MKIALQVLNYIAFYGLWFICAYAEKDRRPMVAIPIVGIYLFLHLFFISAEPLKEAGLVALLTLVGGVNESVLASFQAVSYEGACWRGVAWWTLALWAAFATTYWHAFSWLSSRPFLAGFLGAIVAPLCYAWLESVEVVRFPIGRGTALGIIGIQWAIILPVTFKLSRWIQNSRKKT
jgi:hypothetical protein